MNPALRPLQFELSPHRSLAPKGFATLMLLIAGISFVTGMMFVLAGAWPVIGFLGLDVLLIWLAFRLNYRAGAHREWILLTDTGDLVVRRHQTRGNKVPSEWRIPAYWARADLETGPKGSKHLYVGNSRQRLRVGAFMGERELSALCDALNDALRIGREPGGPATSSP